MRILFCVNKDLYSCVALNHLRQILVSNDVKVTFSCKVGNADDVDDLNKLFFYEQEFPINNLFTLIDNSNYDNKASSRFLTFTALLKQYGIDEITFKNINYDSLDYFDNVWMPDLIISIRFGNIFKGPIINLPKYGIINLHSAILPQYRGIMSTFWAMKNFDDMIGSTLHLITNDEIDKGKIINISRIKPNYDKSLVYNIYSLYENGCDLIIKAISDINKFDKIIFEDCQIDNNFSNYYSYPNKNDFDDFKSNNQILNLEEYLYEIIGNFL